jgi:NADPH:quinone reductase-like Zn-dependent oxidoreductase
MDAKLGTTMTAVSHTAYGSPEGLRVADDVPVPSVGTDGVLVRVLAASVNPLDAKMVTGEPYLVRMMIGLRRPRNARLGVDFAGRVEAVGSAVTNFAPGDEVFGCGAGTFAEFVAVPAGKALLAKPAALGFDQAAAVPIAGLSALQALRDTARLRAGQRVLVNGAAGGIGTFAVQIAKALGAEVTGVCSSGNVDLVRSIGADTVIDYTRTDFVTAGRPYDVIVDLAGNRSLANLRRALVPKGTLVAVGAHEIGKWVAPITGPLKLVAASPFVGRSLRPFLTRERRDDLAALVEFLEAGTVVPVIGRRYPLREVPAAIAYVNAGHARGKVVVTTG